MKKIKITKNGPYVVTGSVPLDEQTIEFDKDEFPLNWKKLKDYPLKHEYHLCRCGKSKNKPFCDGAHIATGFNGTETANHELFTDKAEKIVGPSLTLSDASKYCAGASFCDRAGSVWNLVKDKTYDLNKKIATQECANCPSGRLVLHDSKTGALIEPELAPSISLVEYPEANSSGPIWVKGGIPIESADGTKYEKRNRVTLCRCGKSKNKPFCDGAHANIGFNSKK